MTGGNDRKTQKNAGCLAKEPTTQDSGVINANHRNTYVGVKHKHGNVVDIGKLG